jgi:dTDP-4-amino-4,6-dideoxygalactose transaminase
MHTFGFPSDAEEIKKICEKYNLILVEDAAESLGSFYKGQHTGKIGEVAILSFNGNKIITTGGGGMILTDNEELAFKAKHITSTAKVAHKWEFTHDEIGFNYRMPNLNAALGLAQMESLNSFLDNKRQIAKLYQDWGDNNNMIFFKENPNSQSNYWLNTVITKDRKQRDVLLEETNNKEILTRPSWTPMHKLKINEDCQAKDMSNTNWLHERIVNVPSSVIIK